MIHKRQYTFEVNFLKGKTQYELEMLVKKLGYNVSFHKQHTYYSLEIEEQKTDIFIDYERQVNRYRFQWDAKGDGDIDKRVTEVTSFFKDLSKFSTLPQFQMSKGVIIQKPSLFLKSHLGYVEGMKGKVLIPYLDRLESVQRMIELERI